MLLVVVVVVVFISYSIRPRQSFLINNSSHLYAFTFSSCRALAKNAFMVRFSRADVLELEQACAQLSEQYHHHPGLYVFLK